MPRERPRERSRRDVAESTNRRTTEHNPIILSDDEIEGEPEATQSSNPVGFTTEDVRRCIIPTSDNEIEGDQEASQSSIPGGFTTEDVCRYVIHSNFLIIYLPHTSQS